jgi:hypothetical protein
MGESVVEGLDTMQATMQDKDVGESEQEESVGKAVIRHRCKGNLTDLRRIST